MNADDKDMFANAFENYFMAKEDDTSQSVNKDSSPITNKTGSPVYISRPEVSRYNVSFLRQMADSNISDIDVLADLLKKLCNAAWGTDWGTLSPDLRRGSGHDSIEFPQITIEINHKEVSEGMPIKPMLFDTIREQSPDGSYTGESFLMYRQFFDYNIEFNIYGETAQEARRVIKDFQKLISVYTGYIKKQGISEILFQSQDSGKASLNYQDNITMIPLYYYVRMENIFVIRKTNIDRINAEIGMGRINIDKLETVIKNETSGKQTGELDALFFVLEQDEDKNTYQ